jgi:DNA-binding LacI/PurR family transcriptional regulator
MSNVTIYDVAKRAGVSPATVSRVINQRGGLKSTTVHNVEHILKELNFRPRWKAAPIKSVGLVVFPGENYLNQTYNGTLLSAVTNRLFQKGCSVQLIPAYGDGKGFSNISSLAAAHMVGGIIVSEMHAVYKLTGQLKNLQLPCVLMGSLIDPPNFARTVSCDDYGAGREAAAYLYQLGHRRFGVLTATLLDAGHQLRLNGACDFLHEKGITNIWTSSREDGLSNGDAILGEYLALRERPTCLIATNSTMARAVSSALGCAGMRIPEDVSLLGFEDDNELEFLELPITVMRQPTKQIGETAVDMLLDQLAGKKIKQKIIYKCELQVRTSTIEGKK